MPTVRVSVKWRDVEGKTSQISEPLYFDVADVATLAEAQATFTQYEGLLGAVSGCAIVEAEVTFPLTVSLAQAADPGYRTRTGATLSFVDSDGVGQSLYIPGILDDKIANGVVDETDGDIVPLINEIIGNPGVTDPLSTRGSAAKFATFEGGRQSNRKVS